MRIFLELGPGNSCTRMIGDILGDRRFAARSISSPTSGEISSVMRALAMLIAHRVDVDLSALYADAPSEILAAAPASKVRLQIPVGLPDFSDLPVIRPEEEPNHRGMGMPELIAPEEATPEFASIAAESGHAIGRLTDATAEAHGAFLSFSDHMLDVMVLEHQPALEPTAVALTREQCLEFAIGSIANVLGPEFAATDRHPTRVRLPDEPLMLVDRVLGIHAEPLSMGHGRIVTEHDVPEAGWYLDAGNIPTCIAVEAGQADLLLSAYLGIDATTQGEAVYRLLDAVVTFHDSLPAAGNTIRYDIRIKEFFSQGDTQLFRFEFEADVDGRPLMSMKEGCAGFFTQAELEAGQGVVRSGIEQRNTSGERPDDWHELVPMRRESCDASRLQALRAGDLVAAFGPEFADLQLNGPLTIPDGRMRLVHRVTDIDPTGGRFGLGSITAEADIRPDDWFLTCHFVDDRVMPGTLMFECCLHTLRIFLMRMGWVGEVDEVECHPVIGVQSRLKCRGQVLETTKVVTYQVEIKEIGYDAEPYVIADALMFADGKPIVDISDMSLRLSGLSREKLEAMWAGQRRPEEGPDVLPAVYDSERIQAYASGNPSEGFGPPYIPFDQERRLARLPRPPYQFLDRIVEVQGEPFVMAQGATAVAQFDVAANHWYFASNRQRHIPFAVLLEVALQPCGWLAAYVGSALTSDEDLRFRNLGGDAVQLAPVIASDDVLTTRVQLTKISSSADMIIQHFSMTMLARERDKVYEGTTYFGFFTDASLAEQVGIRGANIIAPTMQQYASDDRVPMESPFPDDRFRMVDRIDIFAPEGGPHGLGYIKGSIDVDEDAWFFKAHFYQDPVWPGSLGLEAMIQLLKVFATRRWGLDATTGFSTSKLGHRHRWSYRGQVLPTFREVEIEAAITSIDDASRTIVGRGFLSVDGRVIYEMHEFSLAVVS